jgi:hypothetical protein
MVKILHDAAKLCFPIRGKGFQKHYWSDELSNLKRLSIQAHIVWRDAGSPRNGPLNDNRLLCKQRYKHAMREAKRNAVKKVNNKLVNDLLINDLKSFWKFWNAKFSNHIPSKRIIGDLSNSVDICQGFAEQFKTNFVDSGDNIALKNKFLGMFENYCVSNIGITSDYMFHKNEVLMAILGLAKEKAPGIDNISAEHLLYAADVVSQPLCNLFNACIIHGCVPDSFTTSIIVPVEKDKLCGASSFDNYRPIALVTMFSKVFENCLAGRLMLDKFFDPLQYGFTRGRGCQKALLSVECIVNYFTCRGSAVYMSALDASKAFDRVNHYSLFIALMKHQIPVEYLRIIIYWHLHLSGLVR